MKKIIFMLFAFCTACSDENVKMPSIVDTTTDFSAQAVSETEMRRNGCSFVGKEHSLKLECDETDSASSAYQQRASILRYMKANDSAMKGGPGSDKLINPVTVYSMQYKWGAVYKMAASAKSFLYLNSKEARATDVDEYIRRLTLEYLLYIGRFTNCVADFSESGVHHNCHSSAMKDDWMFREKSKWYYSQASAAWGSASEESIKLVNQLINAFPEYFEGAL